ncbi:hypothetical protein L7F22_043979 [Adiantum nelumboides]|nr:hypothetical protein [Adiantum nelumboides]
MASHVRAALLRNGRLFPSNFAGGARIAFPQGRIGQGYNAANLHTSNVSFKSRRSRVEEPAGETVGEVPVMKTKGKGAKGASSSQRGTKSKYTQKEEGIREEDSRYRTTTTNEELPGEKFSEEALKENMRRAFQRCKETITRMVGSHGRADPAILDGVQVSMPNANPTEGPTKSRLEEGPSYNIKEFATIGTRDGALIVTCFDPSTIKYVERAIYTADVGLSPQRLTGEDQEGILHIPIPRPTSETRAQLSKDISKICENARVSIRTARHLGQKQIRSDEKQKVIGADEARSEMKAIDEETKKQTAEVDKLYEQMKARIEQN